MKESEKKSSYTDIIDLPHPEPRYHRRMSMQNRAAQFLPFAALTGYDEAVHETARITDKRIELDENSKERLDEKLQDLLMHMDEQRRVCITYFVEDLKKDGGEYKDVEGFIKKFDEANHCLKLDNNLIIKLEDILDFQSED